MIALLLLVATADPTPAERIAAGEAAMAALEYDVAADELTLAASDARATDDEKLRASLKAGIASVIINRADMARLHFRYVLLRDPDVTLDADAPQKVTSFFSLIKNELAAERATSAAATPVKQEPATPPPEDGAFPLVPAVVAGAGAAVALGGLTLAGVSETTLGDAALPLEARGGWLAAGRAGLVVVGVGVVVAAAGGALALVE